MSGFTNAFLRYDRTLMLPYKVLKLDWTNALFSKRNKNTKPTLCSLNFTLQTLRACVQTDAQVLIFLFYASACTMHGSIIRPDPIPEKTIFVLMILTLCLALYIIYPNFTLFMLMILRLIKTCKWPIKISKAHSYLVIYVCMNGISVTWTLFITALLRPSIHERWPQLFQLSYVIRVVHTCTCTS